MPMHNEVAAKLQASRLERGWTQTELGTRLGDVLGAAPSRQVLSAWEQGRKRFDVDEVAAFSKVFGTPITWWIGVTTNPAMVH